MKLYTLYPGLQQDAQHTRLGLGYYHGTRHDDGTPDEGGIRITRQTMDAIQGVVADLISKGFLTPESRVFYEFAPEGYPEDVCINHLKDGRAFTDDLKRWVDIKELRTPKDYADFDLQRFGNTDDLYTFHFQGKKYCRARPVGDCFLSVYEMLKTKGIPLIFPDDKDNISALDAAVKRLPSDDPEILRIQEERVGMFARQLFAPGNGLSVLIAGFLDFPDGKKYRAYNKDNFSYVFGIHESVS